jgi:adenylosuccinate synthase
LVNETTWEAIAALAGAPNDLGELTSVTRRLRRVGLFDAEIVRRAIMVNSPTQIVLNHLDYVDWECRSGMISLRAKAFLELVEQELGCSVDLVGTSETALQEIRQRVSN